MTTRTGRTSQTRRAVAALSALGCLALAGCGLGTASGFSPTGTLAGPVADVDLEGADIKVGSKNFTEQLVLGKIAVILMKSAGANVTDGSAPNASLMRSHATPSSTMRRRPDSRSKPALMRFHRVPSAWADT